MTLIERNDGFDYDLRMLCSCGLPSPISAADYQEGAHGSHMTRVHCGESLQYGPAVAALRDPDDPALDDDALRTLAWYTRAPSLISRPRTSAPTSWRGSTNEIY